MKTKITHKEQPAKAHGSLQILSYDPDGTLAWQSPVMPNLVLDSAFSLIVQHNKGNDTDPLQITSLEIGSGNTAVAASDTDLDTLVLDGVVVGRTVTTDKTIRFDFFITDAELADGTYREVMLRAGTIAYTRALFPTEYVKVAGRDTIIRYTLSYDSA